MRLFKKKKDKPVSEYSIFVDNLNVQSLSVELVARKNNEMHIVIRSRVDVPENANLMVPGSVIEIARIMT